MDRYLLLTLHRDFLGLFGFLKQNPTQVYQNGEYFRFVYLKPFGCVLTAFRINKLWLEVSDQVSTDWELVRDNPIAVASSVLLTELEDLEQHSLSERRQGVGLALSGWVLDWVCHGIYTREDTGRLVRTMFVTGYDAETVILAFSSLTRKKDLSAYFLNELNRIYKGVNA